jgi:kinesin family protein 6/9
VTSVLEGYNGTILAYGQTGAGKTFTMTGGTQAYKYRGVAPRALTQIFRHIEEHPESEFSVRVSYLEIYNETFFDLLSVDPAQSQLSDLAVRDDSRGQVVVKGLRQLPVTSEEDALNLLFLGETNRAIAEHQMNEVSTRSHCIFTVYVESRSRVESSERRLFGKLHLVDLAGSERVGKTGSSGAILTEAKYINKSLTFLEQVVIALASRSREQHVPFRQSKLTNFLRDSLGGNCRTRLIANIWAERAQLDETISTLRFATRMMGVTNEPVVNVALDPQQLLAKYERTIRELKQELAMHDALANRAHVTYEEVPPEQQLEMRRAVAAFVRGESEELRFETLVQARELFKQFRAFARELQAAAPQQQERAQQQKQAQQTLSQPSAGEQKEFKSQGAELVGDLDETAGGFHVGSAPADARPSVSSLSRVASPTAARAASPAADKASAPQQPPQQPQPAAPSESEALAEYYRGEGAAQAAVASENARTLREKRGELRALSEQVNAAKRAIDDATAKLHERRAHAGARPAGEVAVVDEEEYALLSALKRHKAEYVARFNDRKRVQSEVSYVAGLLRQARFTLAAQFLEWFRAKYPAAAASGSGAASGAEGDVLDSGERFDAMETQRLMAEDPEAVTFYHARKNALKARAALPASPPRRVK